MKWSLLSRLALLPGAAVAAGAMAVAGIAVAPGIAEAERCRIEIAAAGNLAAGADLPATGPAEAAGIGRTGFGAWGAAATALERALQAHGAGDCREIRIEVADGRARVTFATGDGRQAERVLAEPSELGPAVDAVCVTYVVPAPAVRAERTIDDETPPAIQVASGGGVGRWQGTPATEHTSPSIGLQLGFRGGDELVSPTIEIFTRLGVGAWDLGVFLRSEPRYRNTEPEAVQPKTQGGSLGISVGRRMPLGGAALVAGGSIGLAGFHQEDSYVRGEGRLGAYIAAVLPRQARTRVRAGLGTEISMTHLGASETDSDGTKLVPWLAILLSVAVEYGSP